MKHLQSHTEKSKLSTRTNRKKKSQLFTISAFPIKPNIHKHSPIHKAIYSFPHIHRYIPSSFNQNKQETCVFKTDPSTQISKYTSLNVHNITQKHIHTRRETVRERERERPESVEEK